MKKQFTYFIFNFIWIINGIYSQKMKKKACLKIKFQIEFNYFAGVLILKSNLKLIFLLIKLHKIGKFTMKGNFA